MKLFQQQLKYENAIPNGFAFSPNEDHVFMHMEQVYTDLDRVCQAYEVVGAKNIHPSEFNLANHLLDNIQTVSVSGLRFESNQTETTRLKLRCESFMEKIMEKIKSFWRWLIEKIKGFFMAPIKEAKEELRKQAVVALTEISKAVDSFTKQQPITFEKLHGIEIILGNGDFNDLKTRLNEITAQYGYVGDFAKRVTEDFEAFLGNSIPALLIPQTALEASTKFIVANGSNEFSGSQSERIYYVGRNKAFVVKETEKNLGVELTETSPNFKTAEAISLTKNELTDMFKLIPAGIKKIKIVNDYFANDFVLASTRIEKHLAETSKSIKEDDPTVLKNKLRVLQGFNDFAMVALRLSKEYYQTGEKLKQAEIDMLNKVIKASSTFTDAKQLEKDIQDPNVTTIVL